MFRGSKLGGKEQASEASSKAKVQACGLKDCTHEYLSWSYTDKDITDKDITDEDCIHESNYAMSKGKYVPVSQKHNPNVKSPVPVTGCVLGLANVTTCNEIVNKMGVRKSEICADKAKGKREVLYGS
ncbi:hypothetical protein Tco_1526616 [Tanacetum coccineum]